MGGILVKYSGGAGGVEEQGQKHRQQAGSYRESVAFLQTKKKALQCKTFLNFGAPRETRTPTPFENGF
jgi:hypothetical protein